MGSVLSLPLLFRLGDCVLLLDSYLFDGRVWRCRAAAGLADFGPSRMSDGRAYVWAFRKLSVRRRRTIGGPRREQSVEVSP